VVEGEAEGLDRRGGSLAAPHRQLWAMTLFTDLDAFYLES